FFLAGMLVVFTVVKKKEVEFEPPKAVERPKMKLKKPKPKVKKSARPKKAQNILAKVNPVNMPDIQLPEIGGGGLGGGLGEGIGGGFDTMPDLSEPTLFGTTQSIGNDFVGTFYDIKRDRRGKPLWSTDLYGHDWRNKINKFLLRGWDFGVFSRYYRSPNKLYATSFVVPVTLSSLAPAAFGDKDACGGLWLLHYEGQLVCPASHTNGITFRFWAAADEFMVVKVDGKIVLGMDWRRGNLSGKIVPSNIWNTSAAESRQYYKGGTACEVGDWITLEPGEALEMEMVTGGNGGADHHILMVEEQGVEYESAKRGGPLLPVFKTSEFSHDKLDLIYKELPEGEMCLTNGPVFCDYDTSGKAVSVPEVENPETRIPDPESRISHPKPALRTWTLVDGRTLEAEFVNLFGGKVVLKNAKGKIKKVPREQLSAEDIEHAELTRPPDIDINFLNSLKTVSFSGGFYDFYFWYRYDEQHGHFGLQLKQTSAGDYNHELKVDMFVVGQQREGNQYLLLDRQQFTFNPVEEDRFFEFRSKRKVELQDYPDYYKHMVHGDKYVGYLVTVTDKRGVVITTAGPKKWLAENLDSLKKLKVGNYFDKSCARTFPDRPPFIPIDEILISE
ncbi:MAG: SHD1 domain-containing protein, partial [Verrucomicrobiota bacterium]